MRKNTNGGPGCRQYRVQLVDGRIRYYFPRKLTIPGSIQNLGDLRYKT